MLVIDVKVIDYKYFMDELQPYELQLFIDMLPWATHIQMEQTRMIMYSIAAPYMKQKKNIKDFLPLPTDHNDTIERLEGDELKEARLRVQQAFKIKTS